MHAGELQWKDGHLMWLPVYIWKHIALQEKAANCIVNYFRELTNLGDWLVKKVPCIQRMQEKTDRNVKEINQWNLHWFSFSNITLRRGSVDSFLSLGLGFLQIDARCLEDLSLLMKRVHCSRVAVSGLSPQFEALVGHLYEPAETTGLIARGGYPLLALELPESCRYFHYEGLMVDPTEGCAKDFYRLLMSSCNACLDLRCHFEVPASLFEIFSSWLDGNEDFELARYFGGGGESLTYLGRYCDRYSLLEIDVRDGPAKINLSTHVHCPLSYMIVPRAFESRRRNFAEKFWAIG